MVDKVSWKAVAHRNGLEMTNAESQKYLNDNLPHCPYAAKIAREEWANALSHGVGCALGLMASAVLLRRVFDAGSLPQLFGCSIYAASLVALFAASTMSHWVQEPSRKSYWRAWDQGLIYLLIAGTYTPLSICCFDGWWHLLTVAVWIVAIGGFVSKVGFRHRVEDTAVGLYLGLGWLAALGSPKMLASLPPWALGMTVAGGLTYTFGTALLANDHRAPFLHVGWHLLVIVASGFHFWAVWAIVASTA